MPRKRHIKNVQERAPRGEHTRLQIALVFVLLLGALLLILDRCAR